MIDGLGTLGESVSGAVRKRIGRASARLQEARDLPVDVLESDEDYLVVFDAPGADASDVQVRYVDGEVRVRIDRFREFREGFETVLPGRGLSLDGCAGLPEDAIVDPEAASATLTARGTLEVTVPKGSVPAAVGDGADDSETDTDDDGAPDGDDSGGDGPEAPNSGSGDGT